LDTSVRSPRCVTYGLIVLLCLGSTMGCYAPLRCPAIPARCLPDSYRDRWRETAPRLNLASLTVPPTADYILGRRDVLEVTVPDLFEGAELRPMTVQVMANGEIYLPLVGPVKVGGMNLMEAQEAITNAYADGILESPVVNVSLSEEATFTILVVGEVRTPGIYELRKFENDVGHAVAAAGGFTNDAEEYLEVHRRLSETEKALGPEQPEEILQPPLPEQPSTWPWEFPKQLQDEDARQSLLQELETFDPTPGDPKKVLKIPMRGLTPGVLRADDVTLNDGDVVHVPSRRFDVFWVVGQLDESNLVRFSLGDRERELGAGLVLPRDRDIDVVTAVAMAGYIDPIDSPTTVTVHRTLPNGSPMLIKVDLIAARYDKRETVLVERGDIIYVNPDAHWWVRRQLDRIAPTLLTSPYVNAMVRWIVNFD